jgi:hypothetical protein
MNTFKTVTSGFQAKDFASCTDDRLALIVWHGRSGQSVSFSKIQKVFCFSDQQLKDLNTEFKKRGFKMYGIIFKIDNFKAVCKNPEKYSFKDVEECGVEAFHKRFGMDAKGIIC